MEMACTDKSLHSILVTCYILYNNNNISMYYMYALTIKYYTFLKC